MGLNRDRVLEQYNPTMELGYSIAEYKPRLREIRRHMTERNFGLLFKDGFAELPVVALRHLVVLD